jgi:hypothetical protein
VHAGTRLRQGYAAAVNESAGEAEECFKGEEEREDVARGGRVGGAGIGWRGDGGE